MPAKLTHDFTQNKISLTWCKITAQNVTSFENNWPGEEHLYSRAKQDQIKNTVSRKERKKSVFYLVYVSLIPFSDFLDFIPFPFFLLFSFLSSSDEDAVEEVSDIPSEDSSSELPQEDEG